MPQPASSAAFPRVLHLAQSDSEGGACKAAFRLHEALRESGVASTFHPGRALRGDADILAARPRGLGLEATRYAAFANALPLKAYRRRSGELFSPSILSYGRPDAELLARADVVCLHWIAGAFLRPAQLASLRKPLVWRLSDLWPFTGGCHYPGACRGFEHACGCCPVLGSGSERDLSRLGHRQRARAYRELDLTIVAPSSWIAREARSSSLFARMRVEEIPTGIELDTFRPQNKNAARARFCLPEHEDVLLFGALGGLGDPRKGFADLVRTLEAWAPRRGERPARLVVFGGGGEAPGEIAGLPVRDVGRIDEREALAALYAAADVLIAPFGEDNLPNVVLEAIACGTPVAAYAAGGVPDAVRPGRSGALAPIGNSNALAEALARTLVDRAALSAGARSLAEEAFDLRACAARYARLFADVARSARLCS